MQLAHWIILASVAIFCASLVALPVVLILIPADYFSRTVHPTSPLANRPLLRFGFLLVKNLAGLILVATGIVMLFTPGQGILGMIAGLWLLDFPGKKGIERRLLAQRRILRALNSLRHRLGRPPFEPPQR